jgi:hypothetical protein
MSTGNGDGANQVSDQVTETYDSVVEDLNFDPEHPDSPPDPDPDPGVHSSSGEHDDAPSDGDAPAGHPPGGDHSAPAGW